MEFKVSPDYYKIGQRTPTHLTFRDIHGRQLTWPIDGLRLTVDPTEGVTKVEHVIASGTLRHTVTRETYRAIFEFLDPESFCASE